MSHETIEHGAQAPQGRNSFCRKAPAIGTAGVLALQTLVWGCGAEGWGDPGLDPSDPAAAQAPAAASDETQPELDLQSQALSRSDFGQSRSLSVRNQTGAWTSVPLPAWSLQTTDSTARGPLRDRGVSSFDATSWVGDANSYVDVFDNSLQFNFLGFTIDGSSSGRFHRAFYPHASNAAFFLPPPFPGAIPRSVLHTLPAGFQGRALRHYDRGECAAERSWAQIVGPIATGLTAKLDAELRAASLGGATLVGAASGTPILRVGTWGTPTNADQFTIRARYAVGACDGDMNVSFTGRFGVAGGGPTFAVDSVSAPLDFGDDFCAGWLALAAGHGFNAGALQDRIRGTVETALRDELPGAIRDGMIAAAAVNPDPSRTVACTVGTRGDDLCLNAFRLGLTVSGDTAAAEALAANNARCVADGGGSRGECRFVPNFRRLNTRPDGLEIVIAERRTDPFYDLYAAAPGGFCARPEGSRILPRVASYGTVSVP